MSSNPQLAVQAQSALRLKLGLPVMLVMALAFLGWGGSFPHLDWLDMAILVSVYVVYAIGAWSLSHGQTFTPNELAMATAVLDPVILSCCLFVLGPPSMVFSCFYLFTIVGFGFRFGIAIMRVCHVASLLGFTLVATLSPVWQTHLVAALSLGLLLLLVPLYATQLLKDLHHARAHAEAESLAKSQLLANVSHELRTPLNGIVSSAQLILAENKSNTALGQRATTILELSGALDSEISQLLDAARLQFNHVIPTPSVLDLRVKAEQIANASRPIATMKKVDFLLHVDDRIQTSVMAHDHELSSVLSNLTGNAVKFTDTGHVRLGIECLADSDTHYHVRFSVRDTGIGIPESHQRRLFEPFYRIDNGSDRRYGGTGLGTTIAREHVRRMGSELQIRSHPGLGSEFWFELNLPKASAASVNAANTASMDRHTKLSILVADDNVTNLRLLKEMLQRDGHLVAAADGGLAALQMLSSADFDAVFLDFNMVDMDGMRVFELYRYGKIQVAPTFFITADASPETTEKLMQMGAAGVLHKPIRLEKLRAVLQQICPGIGDAEGPDLAAPLTTPSRDAQSPVLRLVPTEYLAPNALDQIREVNPAPEFVSQVLQEGVSDLNKQCDGLHAAWIRRDLPGIREHAHALKGVALSLGAIRLAGHASVMLKKPASRFDFNDNEPLQELLNAHVESVRALDECRQSIQSQPPSTRSLSQ